MSVQHKRYGAALKARVALEAIKGQKTANQIAAEYKVHPTQIAQWKKQALDGLPELFSLGRQKQVQNEEALIASLYQQIGQQQLGARLAVFANLQSWLNPSRCCSGIFVGR